MQKSIIIGYIGQDAEIKESGNGKQFITFSVAETYARKNSDGTKIESTTWYDCTYNGGVQLAMYLTKGLLICVTGRINADLYTGRDGAVHICNKIAVKDITMLSSSPKQSTQQPESTQLAGRQQSKNIVNQSDKNQIPYENDLPF